MLRVLIENPDYVLMTYYIDIVLPMLAIVCLAFE